MEISRKQVSISCSRFEDGAEYDKCTTDEQIIHGSHESIYLCCSKPNWKHFEHLNDLDVSFGILIKKT